MGAALPRVVPILPRDAIRRREPLYERLRAGLGRKLILVHAGAGGGKTAFLAAFAREQESPQGKEPPIPVAWLTLDRLHRDRVTLLQHIVYSLRCVHPDLGITTIDALSNSRDALQRWDYILDIFVREMREVEMPPTLFVLDQFEMVISSGAMDTIDYLARSFPRSVTLLLSTRQLPDLPSIPRLRAQGEVWDLTTGDLCFTTEEAGWLFSEQLRLQVSIEALQSLVATTGGWPAMVRMAGSLGQTRGEQALFAFSGSLPEVYDYIDNEVFQLETSGARTFLLSTALADQITQELGRALAQDAEALAAMSRLERGDFYVSTVEAGAERCYRHNPVFRDFLVVKLEESLSHDHVRGLHCKLAEFYSRSQQWDGAIFHLLEAAEYQKASELIATLAESTISANNLDTLARWLDSFPKEEQDRRPWLLLYRGVVHRVNRQWDAALACYNRAAEIFREQGERGALARTLWYTSQILAYRRNQRLAVSLAGQALTIVASTDMQPRAWLMHIIGNCHFDLGEMEDSLRRHRESCELFVVAGDARGEMIQCHAIALALYRLGRLKEAQEQYLRALGLQSRSGEVNVLCWLQAGLSHLRALRGDHSDVLVGLKEAVGIARAHHFLPAEAFALCCLADVYLDLGNYEEAETCCREGLSACKGFDDDGPQIDLRLKLMEIDLRTGRSDLAQRPRLAVEAQIAASNLRLQRICFALLEATIALAEGRLDQAELRSLEARNMSIELGTRYSEAQARYVLARVHLARGEFVASARLVEELLVAVEGEGYTAFLIRDPEATGELLANASRHLPRLDRLPALLKKLAGLRKEVAASWCEKEEQTTPDGGTFLDGQLRSQIHALAEVAEPELPKLDKKSSPKAAVQVSEAKAEGIPLEVLLLGPLKVRIGQNLITDRAWRTSKAKELFAYLVTRPDGSATRDELLEVLWPDLAIDSSVSNFHFTLHSLRRALEPEMNPGSPSRFLSLSARRYKLTLPPLAVIDSRAFRARVSEGAKLMRSKQAEAAVAVFERAVEMYHGDYLIDLYADWTEPERASLLRMYLNTLRQLMWAAYTRQDYEQVVRYADATILKDNYLEEAHRLRMRAACETGNPGLAIRQYERLADLLKAELGTKPDGTTTRLYLRIREGTYQRPTLAKLPFRAQASKS